MNIVKKLRCYMNHSLWFLLTGLMAFIVVGCSSSSSDSPGESIPLAYTGVTDPATINENNAQELMIGAYTGMRTGTSTGVFSAVYAEQENSEILYMPITFELGGLIKSTLDQVQLPSDDFTFMGAVQQETETVSGSCGGSCQITMNLNDVTGDMSGTMVYNNFCEEGAEISGTVNISGQFDLYTLELTSLTMAFNNVTGTYTYNNESETLYGEISITQNGSSITMNMDMVSKDNNTGKTYWTQDYLITETETYSGYQQTLSGTFHNPDYGHVEIYTEQMLVFDYMNIWPSSGIIVIEGGPGSAGGNTAARLTVISSVSYQIEVDSDGDDVFDPPVIENWPNT